MPLGRWGQSALLNRQGITTGAEAATVDPTLDLYPAMQDAKYTSDRPITMANITEQYNNFYEYGEDKDVFRSAGVLKTRPWTIKIDGLVDKPLTLGVDDIIRKFPLEERIYRHRCVEAWSFVVPWTGFQLSKLVELAKPTSAAQYLQIQTFFDPSMAPGENQFFYPWPYTEGLTMAEATNEWRSWSPAPTAADPNASWGAIAPAPTVDTWFKSIKSLVKFSFVKDRPMTFWEVTGPTEYGFWANVNPGVPHPRWSQAMERDLGTGNLIPTKLFNGYADYVASIYTNLNKTGWM